MYLATSFSTAGCVAWLVLLGSYCFWPLSSGFISSLTFRVSATRPVSSTRKLAVLPTTLVVLRDEYKRSISMLRLSHLPYLPALGPFCRVHHEREGRLGVPLLTSTVRCSTSSRRSVKVRCTNRPTTYRRVLRCKSKTSSVQQVWCWIFKSVSKFEVSDPFFRE